MRTRWAVAIVAVAAAWAAPSAQAAPLFQGAQSFDAGRTATAFAKGDFNEDSAPDLAVANNFASGVSILLGDGAGGFGPLHGYGAGQSPSSVAVGDVNGDSHLDLAVTNRDPGKVSILLGDGAGGFSLWVSPSTGASGAQPNAVAIGDFNDDSAPDLAVANQGTNNVAILLGDGTGWFGFGPTQTIAVGDEPNAIAVGNFDGDSAPDLAVANVSSDNVSILRGNGTGGFGPAQNHGVGDRPVDVAVGNLNGDSALDLAVTNQGTDNVSILPGDGTGGFGPAQNHDAGDGPNGVAVGDVNGDSHLDLAVADPSDVSILLGNGVGGFAAAQSYHTGAGSAKVVMDDFGGNAALDLAVLKRGSDTITLLLGDGSGSFGTTPSYAAGDQAWRVATGDFNGDSHLDLAVPNPGSATISVLLGDGTGGFGAATSFGTGANPNGVAVGDFNGDSDLDLAVVNYLSSNVSILLGDGAGGFGAAQSYAVPDNPWAVALGDFNGDSHVDLVVTDVGPPCQAPPNCPPPLVPDKVSILLGNGSGGFGAPTSFDPGGSFPGSVAVGDFNGDTDPDVAVANLDSNKVSILIGNGAGGLGTPTSYVVGEPSSVVVGDFNGDSALDLAMGGFDVTIRLGNGAGGFGGEMRLNLGGGSPVAVGDFNGDSDLDLAVANNDANDVSILLGNGAGGFGGIQRFSVGSSPRSIAVGDFDGNSAPDLAVANLFSDDVSILLATGPPSAPILTATDPPSPANDSSPKIKGTAERGSTVKLYTSSDCTGAAVATGTAAQFTAPGLTVTVADNSTTTFRATATDSAGRTSACSSSSISYTKLSGYPRPKGAGTQYTPLVPAYKPCAGPNRQHAPPLSFPSCNPPEETSPYLSLGTPDANGQPAKSVGSLRLGVLPGNPQTPADEAEIGITASITDVRNRSDLSDYTGSLGLRFALRITDKSNSPDPAGQGPGTVVDFDYAATVPCAATPDATIGAACTLESTADAIAPGTAVEGRRAIWQVGQVTAMDGGADGDATTTGDNAAFLRQGIFVP